jgi:hypothetical protein
MLFDHPFSLKTALKELEAKTFNKELTRSEIEYESLKHRVEKAMRDPSLKDYVEREEQKQAERDSLFRSYRISNEEEDADAEEANMDKLKAKLLKQQQEFLNVSNENEFKKRSLKIIEASRSSNLALM